MDRKGPRRRAVGQTFWLLALLLAASWLAGSIHWITTPHRVCEIHGTIEHGRVVELDHAVSRAPTLPAYRGAEAPHDECPLGPYARTEAFPVPRIELADGVTLACTRATPFVRSDPLPDPALFLLAPSRSPPAAGV